MYHVLMFNVSWISYYSSWEKRSFSIFRMILKNFIADKTFEYSFSDSFFLESSWIIIIYLIFIFKITRKMEKIKYENNRNNRIIFVYNIYSFSFKIRKWSIIPSLNPVLNALDFKAKIKNWIKMVIQ